VASTPDELLLFFHHVPYTYVLHSGKTVIQHIYDSHYHGAQEAAGFVDRWRRLEQLIDRDRYTSVLAKLEYQAGHATVWRDAINSWFLWVSGIPDAAGRAGHFPGRVEAESMTLERFTTSAVIPWETASAGQSAMCTSAVSPCTARHRFQGVAGSYDIAVQYFDENDGAATFAVFVGDRRLESWTADAQFGSPNPNGHTATRQTVRSIALNPGDELRIEVTTAGADTGALDYIEFVQRRP
jgi:alpha-glucuronidase